MEKELVGQEWKINYTNKYLAMENVFTESTLESERDKKRDEFIHVNKKQIPDVMYHYMPFSQKHHVKSFVTSKLWFSYPKYFNDPNDSKVILDFRQDLSTVDQKVFMDYMTKALQQIRVKIGKVNEELMNSFQKISKDEKNYDARFHKYFLENLIQKYYSVKCLLESGIEEYKKPGNNVDISNLYEKYKKLVVEALLTAYDKEIAICSFCNDYRNMLMWTHYADYHKGICMAYSSQELFDKLGIMFPVIYYRPVRYEELLNYKKRYLVYLI